MSLYGKMLKLVECYGSPFEMGHQYGEQAPDFNAPLKNGCKSL